MLISYNVEYKIYGLRFSKKIQFTVSAIAQKEEKMNKIAMLIANGDITVEELANARELFERAELVVKGLEACKQTITFPFGTSEVDCYWYSDLNCDYVSWGTCTRSGNFACYCNWGGNHLVGSCNLKNYLEVFMSFEQRDFAYDLEKFLRQQIEKAK